MGSPATLTFPVDKGECMYKVLVVGTDGSETADRAVEAAAEIARSWGSELHIVTATRAPRTSAALASTTGAPLVDSGVGAALLEEAAKNIGEEALQKHANGLAAEAHAAQGNADDVILATAAEVGADLIVVGNKGMRGARRYLGSVPNSIAHGAQCAVLIVKTN
jgi:nucleotide-binding universal stress UspA family protein